MEGSSMLDAKKLKVRDDLKHARIAFAMHKLQRGFEGTKYMYQRMYLCVCIIGTSCIVSEIQKTGLDTY